ncbi:MAG: PIG-L family deacetylase [Candidatus Omnitrophica bacterium]|nr:PIG-L family deacetylase [Candidatus Omnitrophota bacterium]MDD5592175.1 PIG-L family deacetylase [Candidatus Omnitrophota bacterium]
MVKKSVFILVYIVLTIGYAYACATIPQPPPLTLNSIKPIEKNDRILILAPHPDDEAIGCAGIIQEAVDKGADIRIAYLTNGDHNQVAFIVYEKRLTFRKGEFIHMGDVRRKEAAKAMKLLGVDEKKLIFLGYPDFGTLTIFKDFWQSARPYKSMLTRISQVPSKENFSFGAPYKGENILADIKKILRDYKPNKIFVSHPADTNVDHKALYLFLRIALCDLGAEIPRPEIYPYLVHCLGWPLPRHYHPQLGLNPPRQFSGSQVEWLKFDLTPEQLNKKYQAILCHRSQTSSSAFYLLSFARKNELFGDYPDVELKKEESPLQKAISFFGFSNMFADSGPGATFESSKQLTENKGQVSYGLSGDILLIRVDKPRELNRKFRLQLYLFGYSTKIPFASMPKIRIITKYKKFKVFDARKMIKAQGIDLEFNHKELILKVPLKILGDPDFILSAVKTYTSSMHVDTTSFRNIIIK